MDFVIESIAIIYEPDTFENLSKEVKYDFYMRILRELGLYFPYAVKTIAEDEVADLFVSSRPSREGEEFDFTFDFEGETLTPEDELAIDDEILGVVNDIVEVVEQKCFIEMELNNESDSEWQIGQIM